ncbi:hypothetical protein ACFU98_35755 [Streptomyces sp. NPDC057575]
MTSRLLRTDDAFGVAVDATLDQDERLTILTTTNGNRADSTGRRNTS